MIIRKAIVEDAAALAKVHIASYQTVYQAILPARELAKFSVAQHTQRFCRAIEAAQEETYVLSDADQVIGFITVGDCRDEDLISKGCGEIWGVYLHPDHWGKGYGRLACDWAEELFRERQKLCIVLWVLAENHAACQFYHALGYRRDGAEKTLDIGGPISAIRFRKNS